MSELDGLLKDCRDPKLARLLSISHLYYGMFLLRVLGSDGAEFFVYLGSPVEREGVSGVVDFAGEW